MSTEPLPAGFRAALLFEFDIAERQLLALAKEIPAEKFAWRPDETARSTSEVFVHVALGNFFLLSLAGHTPPLDLYSEIVAEGEERLWSVVRRNDELEKSIRNKDGVLNLLNRSLRAVRNAINECDEHSLEEPLNRRLFMRMIAHSHEHMGQLIAYARVNGVRVPWPDWRPDRRTADTSQ
jgi:uncharacterized damage-inducible protein DinB